MFIQCIIEKLGKKENSTQREQSLLNVQQMKNQELSYFHQQGDVTKEKSPNSDICIPWDVLNHSLPQ